MTFFPEHLDSFAAPTLPAPAADCLKQSSDSFLTCTGQCWGCTGY